ncbi:MAG TPA: serine hydrolase [Pyrinomonadaceae bacterium]|jgi:beta-lactamase class A|nr:serine hydrolase [Pyrinomonadaceae bacterium]
MKKHLSFFCLAFLIGLTGFTLVTAQKKPAGPLLGLPVTGEEAKKAHALHALIDQAAARVLEKYKAKGLKAENLSISFIDLREPKDDMTIANFNGAQKVYPASVVKLFYLAAVHQWLQTGKLKDTPELRRAMKDMIVDSSNDATQFIVDTLTGTSGGPELSEKELKVWGYKRNAVNRYFTSLGFENINVCQKTYCEDAYGREQQFRGKDGINRNKLTTNATALLLTEIALGEAVNADRSKQMMELLKRDFEAPAGGDADDQAHGFTALALKPGMKLWSKAGWTSTTRHDAAYVETADGRKFVLVVFTTGVANERNIIPDIARIVLDGLK